MAGELVQAIHRQHEYAQLGTKAAWKYSGKHCKACTFASLFLCSISEAFHPVIHSLACVEMSVAKADRIPRAGMLNLAEKLAK